jgi:hypothetical protein
MHGLVQDKATTNNNTTAATSVKAETLHVVHIATRRH